MTQSKNSFMHNIKFCPAAFAAISLISSAADAHAGSAPAQLYNKSITVAWGESGLYKRVSDGVNATPVGQFQLIFYISSGGRVFTRGMNSSGRFGGSKEFGPEKSSDNVRFEGNSLVRYGVSLGVARRVVATFEAGFSSCTASVTIGKSGQGTKIIGFDGAVWEVISMKPSASSCSIRDGNAFAN
jgi:hypothetical protein